MRRRGWRCERGPCSRGQLGPYAIDTWMRGRVTQSSFCAHLLRQMSNLASKIQQRLSLERVHRVGGRKAVVGGIARFLQVEFRERLRSYIAKRSQSLNHAVCFSSFVCVRLSLKALTSCFVSLLLCLSACELCWEILPKFPGLQADACIRHSGSTY